MTSIQMVFLESREAIERYIVGEVTTYWPGRVLIVCNPRQTQFLQSLAGHYEVLINHKCSLSWLCRAAEEIRTKGKRAILASNYPRNFSPPQCCYGTASGDRMVTMPPGTSLQLCATTDRSTWCSIYVVGVTRQHTWIVSLDLKPRVALG